MVLYTYRLSTPFYPLSYPIYYAAGISDPHRAARAFTFLPPPLIVIVLILVLVVVVPFLPLALLCVTYLPESPCTSLSI